MLTTLGIAVVLSSAQNPANLVQNGGVAFIQSAAAPSPQLQIEAIETSPRQQLLFVDAWDAPIICYARPQRPANNNQETVVSASNSRTVAGAVEADDALLSLPEDSGLKALFDADRVVTERLDGLTRHTVYKGELRIVDANGITRARVWAVDSALQIDAKVEHDEVNFTVRAITAAGQPAPVRIHLNHDEAGEERSAIRWQVLQPDESGKPLRLKMQFVYAGVRR